jgi:drug/metabolite transporter (DMT)-like permease
MIFALLTAICWSISGFASSRISRRYGAAKANILRLSIATLILAVICFSRSSTFRVSGGFWFMLAGISHLCIGFLATLRVCGRSGGRSA